MHVAHVVIDGAIDGAFIRGLMPDAAEKLSREEILVPDEIARNYVWLLSSEAQRLDVRNGPETLGGDVVMQPTIEFIFDFASPNVYLAYRALPPILERTGATARDHALPARRHLQGDQQQGAVRWPSRPVKGKIEYEMLEVRRFIAKHRLDKFRMNPHFPVSSLMLMRGLIAARERRRRAGVSRNGPQGHVGGRPQARRPGGV